MADFGRQHRKNMITVYAITDDGDRFRMFQTHCEDFAHQNAKDTARLYMQNIVAYEIDSEVFQISSQQRKI